jgi:hypothetical protein
MIQITAYKTRDGLIHETKEQAIKHCKKVKDDALHNLRLSLQSDLKIGIREVMAITEFMRFTVLCCFYGMNSQWVNVLCHVISLYKD